MSIDPAVWNSASMGEVSGCNGLPHSSGLAAETHLTIHNTPLKITLQGINISHLGKRKIIFKMPFLGDMLVPCRLAFWTQKSKVWFKWLFLFKQVMFRFHVNFPGCNVWIKGVPQQGLLRVHKQRGNEYKSIILPNPVYFIIFKTHFGWEKGLQLRLVLIVQPIAPLSMTWICQKRTTV